MSVAEASTGKHQLAANLVNGITTISESQEIDFRLYQKVTLPTDGSVFWVAAADPVKLQGSFHYSTDQNQNEDESASANFVIFTALEEVNALNDIAPDGLYIGTFEGVQFAFNQRIPYYKQAGLFHYRGNAVTSVMRPQIVDNLGDIFEAMSVVSNSLPIWLTLDRMVDMYPSFLVPPNLAPPYAAVHIGMNDTEAIQAVAAQSPVYEMDGYDVVKPLNILGTVRSQLTRDRVRITLWGVRNGAAQSFLDYVLNWMSSSNAMGLMNMPIIRDDKKTQTELNILGQKKVIEFEVSYHQASAYSCAKKLIESVVPQYILGV